MEVSYYFLSKGLNILTRALPGIFRNIFIQLGEVEGSLLITHGDRLLVGTGQFLCVPGVDDNTAVETLRGTGEL